MLPLAQDSQPDMVILISPTVEQHRDSFSRAISHLRFLATGRTILVLQVTATASYQEYIP